MVKHTFLRYPLFEGFYGLYSDYNLEKSGKGGCMEENFKYKALRELVGKQLPSYEVAENGVFWALNAKKSLAVREDKKEEEENIEKAWNCIEDLLRIYRVKASKVLVEDSQLPMFQRGKEITLYNQHEMVQWQSLLDEITKRFIENNIRPGCLAFSDQTIDGSSFFGCRNDKGPDGKYINGLQAENFNPTNQIMPVAWQKLKITHIHQPPRPARLHEALEKGFYRRLVGGVRGISREFMKLLCPFLKRLNAFKENAPIWEFTDAIREEICFGLSSGYREIVIAQLNEIQNIQKIENEELSDHSEAGIRKEKEMYERRLQLVSEITNSLSESLKAEELAQVMGQANSGNTSPDKSSPKEGSPREPDEGEKPKFG
jgi:hypothetical protein